MSLHFGGPIQFSFLYKVCINRKIKKPVTNIDKFKTDAFYGSITLE